MPSNSEFSVTTGNGYIQIDSDRKIHFIACKQSCTKTINFSVADYNNCAIYVSDDGSLWTRIYIKTLNSTNGRVDSYTIPEQYSKCKYIRLSSAWDYEYQLWYTASVSLQ